MRLNPATGEPLNILFTVQSGDYGLRFADVAQLLKGYYAKVGVDVTVEVVDNEVWTQRNEENSIEASVFTGEGGYGITAITDPRYYVPIQNQGVWGMGWSIWYLTPTSEYAVEPPQEIKDHIALYNQVLQAPTNEERISLMQQVLQTAADNFWVLGISSPKHRVSSVKRKTGQHPGYLGGRLEPQRPGHCQTGTMVFQQLSAG